MHLESPRLGTIEVDSEKILKFENGLPGFPECTRLIVMDHDRDTPLKWLQSVDQPEVAFLIIEPSQIMTSYQLDVPTSVLNLIGWRDDLKEADITIFVILNVEEGELMANLRAPVVVNIADRRAFQMILEDQSIPVRYRVAPDQEAESA